MTMNFDTAERMTKLGIKETVAKWKDRLEQEPCEDAVSRQAVIKVAKDWWGNGVLAIDDIYKLPLVEPTRKWISCSERLPKERGMYIVTEKVFSVDDRKHTGRFNLMTEQVEFNNGKWWRASFYEVIAWMPLPEPYRAEMEGENEDA